MTFIRIDEIQLVRKGRSRHKIKRLIVYSCDECRKEFSRKYTKKYHNEALTRPRFCSNECKRKGSKRGGSLHAIVNYNIEKWKQSFEKTMIERYGVTNPSQLPEHVEKCRTTLLKHYGVTCVLNIPGIRGRMQPNSPEANEKRKQTNIKRYGTENVFASDIIKERIKNTLQTRYGVDKVSQIPGMTEKRSATCLEKYGYDHPWKSSLVKQHRKQTFNKRYGANTYWQSNDFLQFVRSNEFKQRCHETKKKNGTYVKSKAEDNFFTLLCKLFGEENVDRQHRINGFSIDFYIKNVELYIQFDGIYWHGLDRPNNVIKEFKSPRDKVIYDTYLRDQKQNAWFKENNLSFERFTDKDNVDFITSKLSQYLPRE